MSNNPEFRCPVCRARQPLKPSCRRCKADLGLVVRAHRRVAYLQSVIEQVPTDSNPTYEQTLQAELQWLTPKPH